MSNYVDLQRLWSPVGSTKKASTDSNDKSTAKLTAPKLRSYRGGTPAADPSMTGMRSYINERNLRLEFFSIASNESAKFIPMDIEYSESFVSEWNHVSVYGRNDPMSTFQGTKRSIKLGFVVNSNNPAQARANMIEISNLASLLYPTYFEDIIGTAGNTANRYRGNATTIEAAPLLRVHLNNLIVDPSQAQGANVNSLAKSVGLVCASSGFDIQPDFDKGVIITPNGGISSDAKGFATTDKPHKGSRIYPKVYTINTTLTVYHTFPLGYRRDPGDSDTNSYARSKDGFGSFPWGEKHVYSKNERMGQKRKGRK